MELIPVLLIAAIVLLLVRSKGRPFPVSTGTGIASRAPVRLILLVVVVLLLIGLAVKLVAPLGNYSFGETRGHGALGVTENSAGSGGERMAFS